MKKIKYIILFFIFLWCNLCHAQCDDTNTPTFVELSSLNAEKVFFQLCNSDSIDYLIVSQYHSKYELDEPKIITDVEEGNYLLKANKSITFINDNSRFQMKLVKEEKLTEMDSYEQVVVHDYYEITRNKIKLMLLGTIESIIIIKDYEIQTFELTFTESSEFYQMGYRYFKLKKWK
jgi:hypothetical protein